MANESRKKLWPDEDEWPDFFRWRLCGHPELGEHVARIWFALLGGSFRKQGGPKHEQFWTRPRDQLSPPPTYPFTRSYRLKPLPAPEEL